LQRCIYCKEIMLAEGEAGDTQLRPSREHVIPSALGGPDALCTFDVCSGCNSNLGKTTDGEIMREDIVTIVRQKFGMPGYSGKIPELVMPTWSVQTGTAFEMRIPDVGDVIYHAPPQVTSSTDDDGSERFSVRGTRKQVEAIVRSKYAKAKRQGRRMLNPDGSALTSIEEGIAAAVPEETTEFKARFTYNEIPVWRGLIKIAFNFAHVVLGDQWTFSQQAEPLRNAALGRGDNESVAALVSGIRIEIHDLLLRDERDKPTRHLIAIMPGEESRIVVSLAGEELLTVAVRIDVTTRQLEDGLMASNRMMVSTLPKGGNTTWMSLADFTARLVADDNQAIHRSDGQP
jgi:HNH endonuclease